MMWTIQSGRARGVGGLPGAVAALLVGLASVPCLAGGTGGSPIVLAAGGTSTYAIVVADDADPGRVMPAATLLRDTLEEATGARLPILRESALPAGTPAIYLGKTRAAVRANLPLEGLSGWSCLIQAVGRDLHIAGADGAYDIKDSVTIEHRGTLKGVVVFLEEQVGVRFLLPGAFGRWVPKRDPLTVPGELSRRFTPRFDYVIGRAPRSDPVFAVSLNLFGRTPILKSYGGHSYYYSVPKETYGRTHPEYFALHGGVRSPAQNHLCISNPEVQELMLREMGKQFDNGYAWVELAQTDGYAACQCPGCRALHPVESEQLWIVHRRLAEAMRQRRPRGKVMMIAYGPTAAPPRSFTNFPDNVVVQLCRYAPEDFEAWRSYGVEKTVYAYNWGSYKLPGFGPSRTPAYAIGQVRRFLANGVRGIYLCGGYEPDAGYGLDGPSLYAFGRALGDPDLDPGRVLDDYVGGLFGEAAAPMRTFYRALFTRLDAYSLFDRPNVATGDTGVSIRTHEDYFCHVFPPATLGEMRVNLDRARERAQDERVKAALTMVEAEFEYVQRIAHVFHVYRAYRARPTPAAFDLLAGVMEERRRSLDAMYDDKGRYRLKLPGGLPARFAAVPRAVAEMNGRTMGLKPPFNWDVALIRESGVLPGAGKPRRLTVPRVSPFELDGRIDKPLWQGIPFQELNEIGMAKARNATRFKAARDDRAFYLAVECEFDDTAWLDRLRATGRDGNAWQQECIEIGIDPFGEREKHCQLVFSPIPDAQFDARRGYIDDPLHPLYAKADLSWNGNWTYVAVIDRDARRWTAEVRIPFETLDAEPPAAGAFWSFNIGRAEWPIPYGEAGYSQATRYSAWSPNLESRSFHDRASFGDLVFE